MRRARGECLSQTVGMIQCQRPTGKRRITEHAELDCKFSTELLKKTVLIIVDFDFNKIKPFLRAVQFYLY